MIVRLWCAVAALVIAPSVGAAQSAAERQLSPYVDVGLALASVSPDDDEAALGFEPADVRRFAFRAGVQAFDLTLGSVPIPDGLGVELEYLTASDFENQGAAPVTNQSGNFIGVLIDSEIKLESSLGFFLRNQLWSFGEYGSVFGRYGYAQSEVVQRFTNARTSSTGEPVQIAESSAFSGATSRTSGVYVAGVGLELFAPEHRLHGLRPGLRLGYDVNFGDIDVSRSDGADIYSQVSVAGILRY